jgi:hypothetical protein
VWLVLCRCLSPQIAGAHDARLTNHRFVVAHAEGSQVISASNSSTPLERTDHQSRPLEIQVFFAAASLIAACSYCTSIASAQDTPQDNTAQTVPERPTIRADRRPEEDWSVLADPRVARQPLDGLKYIPLDSANPKTYLSLGVTLRERFELDHATFFGAPGGESGQWILSRLEWHADFRLGNHVQVFTQFQNAVTPGKARPALVDQDRLDVEQAFIGLTESLGGGTLRLRLGRQVVAIESQRFASVREGPNLRQSYDAALADYERGGWHVIGAYEQPVQTQDVHPFDDYSNHHLTLSGVKVQRRLSGSTQLSVYYANYRHDAAAFTSVTGNERRNVVDIRTSGAVNGFDWDVEGMNQSGSIGAQAIEAKALGSSAGYTLVGVRWKPRMGLAVDVATGDHDPSDNRLETFNPLFPNGYYLANYTGFPNLIHVKPALTVHPAPAVSLTVAVAGQWRETPADAVYAFPSVPLPGTVGVPDRYTGTYGELRGDWTIAPHYALAFDAVHYAIGTAIRQAGGRDANYLAIQVSYGW